jgi:hypothetical protein
VPASRTPGYASAATNTDAATLVAVVIVFVRDWKFHTSRDAILAGFVWESLLNKLLKSKPEA